MQFVWKAPLDRGGHAGLRDQAQDLIAELGEDLSDATGWRQWSLPAGDTGGTTVDDPTLAGGKAGLALFYAYGFLAGRGEWWRQSALQCLEEAIGTLGRVPLHPSLFGGFVGVAWVATHLEARLTEGSDEDPCGPIDEALLDFLATTPWRHHYDLVSGLVGLGVYALERYPRRRAQQMLERVIDRLEELATESEAEATWWTSAALTGDAERYPKGFYNLGAAHGVPGVVALLSAAAQVGVRPARCRELSGKAVQWLLRQSSRSGADARFGYHVSEPMEDRPGRAAWCYGDPGVAATLSANLAGDSEVRRSVRSVAMQAARRPHEGSGVVDAGLCHGAAGLAHLFSRLHASLGDGALKDAALAWYRRTLELRQPEGGMGGLRFWVGRQGHDAAWRSDPTFLNGAAGVGLALLAATSNVEPEWDRLLLASCLAVRAEIS